MDWDLHGVHISVDCDDPFLADLLAGGMDDVPAARNRDERPRVRVRARIGPPDSRLGGAEWHEHRLLQVDKGRLSLQVAVANSADGSRLRVDYAGRALAVVDYDSRQIDLVVHDPGYFQQHFDPLYSSSVLFKSLLLEVLPECGIIPLHAGMCALGDRGVLICGGPGVGKSSLVLALVRNGFSFLADELGFVRAAPDATVDVLSFPIFGRVAGHMADWVPAGAVVARPTAGTVVFAPHRLPATRSRTARSSAVVTITGRGDGPSELSAGSELDALAALLCYDVYYGDRHATAQFELCAELAARARCFDVVLGGDHDVLARRLATVVVDD